MAFRVLITDHAQRDIDHFARYCRQYSVDFWEVQEARLASVLDTWLATMPHTWSFFFATGAPYRAYLFAVGARTKYWIVYTIDEDAQLVNVLRFGTQPRTRTSFGCNGKLAVTRSRSSERSERQAASNHRLAPA